MGIPPCPPLGLNTPGTVLVENSAGCRLVDCRASVPSLSVASESIAVDRTPASGYRFLTTTSARNSRYSSCNQNALTLEWHSAKSIPPPRSNSPLLFQWCGPRPSVLGQDRSWSWSWSWSWFRSWSCRSGVVLWNKVLLRSLYNDLEGHHSNFSSTLYSFSVLCFKHHYCADQQWHVYLLKS